MKVAGGMKVANDQLYNEQIVSDCLGVPKRVRGKDVRIEWDQRVLPAGSEDGGRGV